MATITHVIRSQYDPADREKLERETGQPTSADPWDTESSFSALRRIRAAPTFVPAADPSARGPAPEKRRPPSPSASTTADWYRSLTASRAAPLRPASAPTHAHPEPDTQPARAQPTHAWFLRNVLLRSEPSTPSAPAPSLADILARDPPPLPSEGRFQPPAWLHIGPSNRGFGMLQRSGWREGEGLGAHVWRSARARDIDPRDASSDAVEKDEMAQEVIDLTLSDSDAEASEDALEDLDDVAGAVHTQLGLGGEEFPSHMQRSLLTPLPTILKADRLGIGLKAKTEGPYRQSKKRVTHNAAALASHIRSAQEMRRKKAEVGKGKRGFAKVHKKEVDWRKSMLAYLNE